MQPTFLRSVLAATDLTVASDEVLRTAAALASAAGAALHVVHALDVAVAPSLSDPGDPSYLRWKADAEEKLSRQLERVLPEGTAPSSRLLVLDLAHRAVLARAEAVGAGLIVLGPHRGRDDGAPLLGSTADRVVRGALVPCLVVRGRLALPLGRVVVPVDLADPARGALHAAFAWVAALGARPSPRGGEGAEVAVIHVVPRTPELAALPGGRASVGPRLHTVVEEARSASAEVPVREELVWGESAGEEIVAYADRECAGLVVLATHGRGVIRRALLGSVASAVAGRAHCPVLLVPPARWSGEEPAPAAETAAAGA